MKKYKFNTTKIIADAFERQGIEYQVRYKDGSEVIQATTFPELGNSTIFSYVINGTSNDVMISCPGLANDIPEHISINNECLGETALEMYQKVEAALNEKYRRLIRNIYMEAETEPDPDKLPEEYRRKRQKMARRINARGIEKLMFTEE